jgi:hypothetical protein
MYTLLRSQKYGSSDTKIGAKRSVNLSVTKLKPYHSVPSLAVHVGSIPMKIDA